MNSRSEAHRVSTRNKVLEKLGVFGRNSALSPDVCTQFIQLVQNAPAQAAEVFRTDRTTLIDETNRRTLSVSIPEEATTRISDVFEGLRQDLSAHFGLALSRHEEPQYLRYGPGAFFAPHRDRPRADGLETSDRKVSLVLFLNDDYEGGRLIFYDLIGERGFAGVGLACDPAPGLAIAFRSDTMHEVTPVTAGERFTIVTWFS